MKKENPIRFGTDNYLDSEPFNYSELDPGIRDIVKVLREEGVETSECCEGGPGHILPQPTVRFYVGDRSLALNAVSAAIRRQLPVFELREVWRVIDGDLTGPHWEMTFFSIRE